MRKKQVRIIAQEMNIVLSFLHLIIPKIDKSSRYNPSGTNGMICSAVFTHEIPSLSTEKSLGHEEIHLFLYK